MRTILVVDDDRLLRTIVSQELTKNGYRVLEAHSAEEARSRLAQHPVDVLLTDYRMDGDDGLSLLQHAAEYDSIRSILMSGQASAHDHQAAMGLGAVHVLCKPFTPPDLINAVEHAIECGTGFRGSIHGISLLDILQMFHYARRSATVRIGGVIAAVLDVRAGEIVHASHGAQIGVAALTTILGAASGMITTNPPRSDAPVTIDVPFQQLILDVLRVIDENGCRDFDDAENARANDDHPETRDHDHDDDGFLEDAAHAPLADAAIPIFAELERALGAQWPPLSALINRIAMHTDVVIIGSAEQGAVTFPSAERCDDLVAAVLAVAEEAGGIARDFTLFEYVDEEMAMALVDVGCADCRILLHSAVRDHNTARQFRSSALRLALAVEAARRGLES